VFRHLITKKRILGLAGGIVYLCPIHLYNSSFTCAKKALISAAGNTLRRAG
jgi:hypothetical protein